MTDDPTVLASAYLDGEATAAEVARVEADEALMAQVERLRSVRRAIGTVQRAPISTREGHLAAAFDAWDRLPEAERLGSRRDATPPGVDAAAVVGATAVSAAPRRRRQRSNAWILAAAAGLVVVLAGGLAVRSLTGDDDSSSDASAEAVEAADDRALDAAESEPADVDDGADEAATEALDPLELTTDPEFQPDPAIVDTDTETDVVVDAPPPEDGLELLSSAEDLAVFAADALEADPELAQRNQTATAVAEEASSADAEEASSADAELQESTGLQLCGNADIAVGPALYGGEQVNVLIDLDRNRALAYDPDTCSLVASASLP
jgi:hypothetical protein